MWSQPGWTFHKYAGGKLGKMTFNQKRESLTFWGKKIKYPAFGYY